MWAAVYINIYGALFILAKDWKQLELLNNCLSKYCMLKFYAAVKYQVVEEHVI